MIATGWMLEIDREGTSIQPEERTRAGYIGQCQWGVLPDRCGFDPKEAGGENWRRIGGQQELTMPVPWHWGADKRSIPHLVLDGAASNERGGVTSIVGLMRGLASLHSTRSHR